MRIAWLHILLIPLSIVKKIEGLEVVHKFLREPLYGVDDAINCKEDTKNHCDNKEYLSLAELKDCLSAIASDTCKVDLIGQGDYKVNSDVNNFSPPIVLDFSNLANIGNGWPVFQLEGLVVRNFTKVEKCSNHAFKAEKTNGEDGDESPNYTFSPLGDLHDASFQDKEKDLYVLIKSIWMGSDPLNVTAIALMHKDRGDDDDNDDRCIVLPSKGIYARITTTVKGYLNDKPGTI